ncbi:alpha/beta fold hydrolase [Leptolyngbya sp. FACHB-17]|uniref:alpha/beta hydrolase n=1 Tax=unclassified Leptolyngbya TaxID=2650499 RepID=UPI0016802179|nr:alpha/beta fold hydrolase [Leptolyngbya sp. FACHB-17]MBD2080378.1 alpha/beta fold hydrolase [Leptolyngbya sp. FACHB-17]
MNIAADTIPTLEQINQTKSAIDAYIQSLNQNPDGRDGALPYYLFHEPGRSIRGTVMIFHGFSAKPHQMWRLADYLFRNGFNVYQPSIAGHPLINPAKNWCQVDLKPEYAEPIKEKVQKDPVLQAYIKNFTNNPGATRPGFMQQMGLMARLVMIEPQLLDIIKALELPDDPDFDRYFISSHLRYLTEAQARLNELAAMPGDIFTVGLSVGGAVALGLAASRPDRVRRVVAYAPLLKIYGEERRRYVNLAGPLDISESGWDANLRFPVGCLTAADRFGSSMVLSDKSVRSLSNIPTFLVLTENEDAADIETNQDFYQRIGGEGEGHRFFLYPKEDLVPHPMVDPTEVSQNMSNRFWQSLYQETFRFLTAGRVNTTNLHSIEQDPNLPIVPPV